MSREQAIGRDNVRFCYCDESGTGEEPIATMVGIVADSQRMHVTKEHWADLLGDLSKMVGRPVREFHTADFYRGNGVWRDLDGNTRSAIITAIFEWVEARKHSIVYASVVKEPFYQAVKDGNVPDELNTLWRFLGFHVILAMQRHCQRQTGVKGHTLFVFDNQEREKARFADLIASAPDWSDEYYGRAKKQGKLDQLVDCPYFADSQDAILLQVADCFAFFARRHAEIQAGLVGPRYSGEDALVAGWMKTFAGRSIGRGHIYPKIGRNGAQDLFYSHAPACLRDL